jgi:L-aminopeptidase/D-esterase-like protein
LLEINNLFKSKSSKEVYAAKGWFSWSSVDKNDIAGAIGGALVGSAAGGVGAGLGAAAGFVGGGIGTSATDAVLQVIDQIF